jgi:hypothetical protein
MSEDNQENTIDNNECEMCQYILQELKSNGDIISHIKDKRKELIIQHFIINPIVGHCRGLGLCTKHMATIKRDNKYRISKGFPIPEGIKKFELVRKLQDSDI